MDTLRRWVTLPTARLCAFWCVCTVLIALLVARLPLYSQLAYDWQRYFRGGQNVPAYYPPWTGWLTRPLTWPTLAGVTVATYAVAVMRKARTALSAAAAFLALPLFWTIYLGQLDGLALLGVLCLPWLAPLALTKPQVAAFALLSQKRAVLIAVAFLVLTVAVWGLWPLEVLQFETEEPATAVPARGMSIWPWGGLLFVPLVVWMPKDDEDWWMLAGATVAPLLAAYHFLPLMPALARLPPIWAFAVAVTSWMPFLANWTGLWGWYLGWVPIVVLALGLAWTNRHRG